MPRRKKCKPDQHVDRRMRGGKRSVCVVCGDVFPCKQPCEHFDCELQRLANECVENMTPEQTSQTDRADDPPDPMPEEH